MVQLPPLPPQYWQLCRCHKSSISALGRTAASAETLGVEDLGSALGRAFPYPPAVRCGLGEIAMLFVCLSLPLWEQLVLSSVVLAQLINWLARV